MNAEIITTDLSPALLSPVDLGSSQAPALPPLPVLLEKVRVVLRQRRYSARTETAFVDWVARFVAFFAERGGERPTETDMRAFLEQLAKQSGVSPAARNQARAALLVLFHGVLGQQLNCTDGIGRAFAEGAAPATLHRSDVERLLAALEGQSSLIASLVYGSGLRLKEAVLLRIRDIDFAAGVIHLRDDREERGDRVVVLPAALVEPLRAHIAVARSRHEEDLRKQAGFVSLPDSVRLATPEAQLAFEWQWLFSTGRMQRDPLSGEGRRLHQHEAIVERALTDAARGLGLTQCVNSNALRHTFAIHLTAAGQPIALVQALLGVGTVDLGALKNVPSPLDLPW